MDMKYDNLLYQIKVGIIKKGGTGEVRIGN